MQIQIKNNVPFSGVVFAKNKYDSCRIEVATASQTATLHMGLPTNFGMKPIVLNANASPEEKIAELKAAESRDKEQEDVNANEIRRRRQVCWRRDFEEILLVFESLKIGNWFLNKKIWKKICLF